MKKLNLSKLRCTLWLEDNIFVKCDDYTWQDIKTNPSRYFQRSDGIGEKALLIDIYLLAVAN